MGHVSSAYLFVLSSLLLTLHTDAFSPVTNELCTKRGVTRSSLMSPIPTDARRMRTPNLGIHASPEEASDSDGANSDLIDELEVAQTRETPKLTDEDKSLVRTLYKASDGISEAMENAITADLDNLHPRLVVALQMAADKGEWKDDEEDDEFEKQMVALGTTLKTSWIHSFARGVSC